MSWSSFRSWLPSLNPSAYAYPSVIHRSRTSTSKSNVKTAVEDNRFYYTVVVDTTQLKISVDRNV